MSTDTPETVEEVVIALKQRREELDEGIKP